MAPDGAVYVSGTSGPRAPIVVARSSNAKNPSASPAFTAQPVDLGGTLRTGGPDPAGLLGQIWIAADRSAGPRAGSVYVLASVATAEDPMDVHFIRSADGGQTWSVPVRVNDDRPGNGAWQWFGTMSVAPDGRIDAVWNDTRATGDSWRSALYHSYSTDGGSTWSGNEQVSPIWDSRLGWPDQEKIGDYYHMISDSTGADLAWAATFNGEQDVYYVRIPQPTLPTVDPGQAVRLYPGIPNPFGGSTSLAFDLPAGGAHARLAVYDPGGRRIAILVDARLDQGRHVARWNGTDRAGRAVASGLDLCRLEAGGHAETSRIILLRR